MAVSIADVAKRSGVSTATVSRVLNANATHPVSAATRDRVLAAAATLGYRSNPIGRALRAGYMQLLSVVVHDIRDPYFVGYARGVSDAARSAGFLTVVASSDRDPETEYSYVAMFADYRVAGVLLAGSGFESDEYVTRMQDGISRIRQYGGFAVSMSARKGDLPTEVADNVGGGALAVNHLIELGHRRIGLINGPASLTTSVERRRGYTEAMRAAGLPVDEHLVASGDFSESSGAEAMAQILESGRCPSAIFSVNDAMALGCIQELHRRGLRVPDDVSIVGFGDIPTARWVHPPLTTVRVPITSIGAAATHRLLAMLNSKSDDVDTSTHIHPVDLAVRGTTAEYSRLVEVPS